MKSDELEYEEFVMLERMAYHYIYRNGKKNVDGSLGEVKMTPPQLKDALIEAYLRGRNDQTIRND